jgi:hypothetical protein
MTPQFLTLIPHLTQHGRPVRHIPPASLDSIPIHSRRLQLEYLQSAVDELSKHLGFSGLTYTGKDCSSSEFVLSKLTELAAEVLSTYVLLGLYPAYAKGIWAYTHRVEKPSTQDYKVIIDDTFSEDDDDQPTTTD